jgi:hypothetical protein
MRTAPENQQAKLDLAKHDNIQIQAHENSGTRARFGILLADLCGNLPTLRLQLGARVWRNDLMAFGSLHIVSRNPPIVAAQ